MLKKIIALVLSMVMLFTMVGTIGVSAAGDERLTQTLDFDTAYEIMVNMVGHLYNLGDPTNPDDAVGPAERDFLYNWVHSYMGEDTGVASVESLITLVDDQTAVANQLILDYIASFGDTAEKKSELKTALTLLKTVPIEARKKAFDDMKARVNFSLPVTDPEQAAIDRTYDGFLLAPVAVKLGKTQAEIKNMFEHGEHLISKPVIMQFLADFNQTFVITDDIETPANFALYELNDEFSTKLTQEFAIGAGKSWETPEAFVEEIITSANGSSYFTDDDGVDEKADFKTVLGIRGIDMYIPREFNVSSNGPLEQAVNNREDIVFTASTNIETEKLSQVEWYVSVDGGVSYNPTPAGTGATYTYPATAVLPEDTIVKVKAVFGGNEWVSDEIKIVAAPTYSLSISPADVPEQTDSASVVFTPATEDPEINDTAWYVNGVQKGTGDSYQFTYTTPGTYKIYALLNGAKSNEVMVTVKCGPVSISSIGSTSQIVGSTSEVTFTATAENGVTDLTKVKWYVNGIDQNVTGATFEFTPTSVGSYVVKAVMPDGSESTNTITVSVRYGGGGGGYIPPKPDKEPDYGDISQPIIAPVATGKVTQFEDVEGHWAEPYMEALYELGIFAGTSETTMSPDWGITRQEVAVLLVRMLGLENEVPQNETYYTDWEDVASWAKTSVGVLSDRGIYVGYGDDSFQPERIISRQELTSVIGRQLSGQYEIDLHYGDTHEIYYWAVDHVEELTAFGIIQGYPDDTFRPVADMTRAEAAVIFYNTMYRLGMIKIKL